MWTYSLIYMGPINKKWIEENGSNWSGGRIECYDSENSFGWSNEEHPILIDSKDWYDFDNWLEELETPNIFSKEELIKKFEEDTKTKVILFDHSKEKY